MTVWEKIRGWSTDKGLNEGCSARQFLKLAEEVGELADALLIADDDKNIIDAIGDCVVVLTILCQQNDLMIENVITAFDEAVGKLELLPETWLQIVVSDFGNVATAVQSGDNEHLAKSVNAMIVSLTRLSDSASFAIALCVDFAWKEIEHRTGKTVDGVFVKD